MRQRQLPILIPNVTVIRLLEKDMSGIMQDNLSTQITVYMGHGRVQYVFKNDYKLTWEIDEEADTICPVWAELEEDIEKENAYEQEERKAEDRPLPKRIRQISARGAKTN